MHFPVPPGPPGGRGRRCKALVVRSGMWWGHGTPGRKASSGLFGVLEESLERGCKTNGGRGAGDVSRRGDRTRWRREIVLHPNISNGTRTGAPRTGKTSSLLVNRRPTFTQRTLPLLVLPAAALTGNEGISLPSSWWRSMCHRRAPPTSQTARTASGRYLSTGFCHERPFLLVKSHQPDST